MRSRGVSPKRTTCLDLSNTSSALPVLGWNVHSFSRRSRTARSRQVSLRRVIRLLLQGTSQRRRARPPRPSCRTDACVLVQLGRERVLVPEPPRRSSCGARCSDACATTRRRAATPRCPAARRPRAARRPTARRPPPPPARAIARLASFTLGANVRSGFVSSTCTRARRQRLLLLFPQQLADALVDGGGSSADGGGARVVVDGRLEREARDLRLRDLAPRVLAAPIPRLAVRVQAVGKRHAAGPGARRPPVRALRGPLPTLGANVHSLVSSPARSLLIRSHRHSFVRGVDSREMRSSLVTASAAPEDPAGAARVGLGLEREFLLLRQPRARRDGLLGVPARLHGAQVERRRHAGRVLRALARRGRGRTARRPAAAAARAGVTNPPAAPRDDAGDSNRSRFYARLSLGDRRDVDPPATPLTLEEKLLHALAALRGGHHHRVFRRVPTAADDADDRCFVQSGHDLALRSSVSRPSAEAEAPPRRRRRIPSARACHPGICPSPGASHSLMSASICGGGQVAGQAVERRSEATSTRATPGGARRERACGGASAGRVVRLPAPGSDPNPEDAMVLDLERTAVARDDEVKRPRDSSDSDLKPNQTRTRRRGDGLRARGTASEESVRLTQPLSVSNALRSGSATASMRARSFQCTSRSHAHADDGPNTNEHFYLAPCPSVGDGVLFLQLLLASSRTREPKITGERKKCHTTNERISPRQVFFVWSTSLTKLTIAVDRKFPRVPTRHRKNKMGHLLLVIVVRSPVPEFCARPYLRAAALRTFSREQSMAAMASSAAVSCKAAASAVRRFGSKSRAALPKAGLKATRRVAVTTSATMAGGEGDFAPAPVTPPPQVFNAASIKVRAHVESDHAPDLPDIFRYAKSAPTFAPGRAVDPPPPRASADTPRPRAFTSSGRRRRRRWLQRREPHGRQRHQRRRVLDRQHRSPSLWPPRRSRTVVTSRWVRS